MTTDRSWAGDARAQVESLRNRQLFDQAVAYVDQLRTAGDVPKETKEVLDYELGTTLLASAKAQSDPAAKEKTLVRAKSALTQFLERSPQHALIPQAKRQLGGVLVEFGRLSLDRAARRNLSDEEKLAAAEKARSYYREAEALYAAMEAASAEDLRKLPKVLTPGDDLLRKSQQATMRDLLESRMAEAALAYEIAGTYPPGSAENRDGLEASAERYHECCDKHYPLLGGLYAKLWEGRSYRDLGQYDLAMQIFSDIANQPDEPASVRELKNKGTRLALETAIMPQVKRYGEGAAMLRAWEASAKPNEAHTADALAIRFFGGKAALEAARAMPGVDPDGRRAANIRLAADALLFVSQMPGELQAQANEELQARELAAEELAKPETLTYAVAKQRAGAALERMQEIETRKKLDEANATAGDIEKMDREYGQARDEALQLFRTAAELAPQNTPVDDLNTIRYYLCYLYWATDHFEEAAVLGEFLAQRYPSAAGAKPAMKIAMAAYAKMAAGKTAEEAAFENGKIVELARLAAKQWPGEPEADQAWMMLAAAAIRKQDVPKALEMISKIPETAPARIEAELMAGQALWGEYLTAIRKSKEERPQQAQLDKLIADSKKLLEQGLARAKADEKTEATAAVVAAVLSVAQIDLETNLADRAIEQLEDPKIGPLALLKADSPATRKGSLAVETYKAALRAYVSTRDLDKAEAIMGELEKHVQETGDAEAGKRLTRIYISLGRELQEQLERLRQENKPEEIAKVAQGFELFLSKILERDKGNTYNSLNWVAETFLGLGGGLSSGTAQPDPQAASYFRKAAESYQKILSRLAEPQFGAPEGAETSIKIRLARCLRNLGDCKAAMAILLDVLKDRPNMVDAQIEAAYTYQTWGSDQPSYFEFAIQGGKNYKEVWGWGQLARRLQADSRHTDIFHEARYNIALCRYRLAESLAGEKRTAMLKQAEADITMVEKLYPEMGGKAWRDKYNELLKRIQQSRKVKPTGLRATPAGQNDSQK